MRQPLPPQVVLASEEPTSPAQLLHDVIIGTPHRNNRADGIAVGTLAGLTGEGAPLVDIAMFELRCILARSVTTLDQSQIGQTVALGFEGGDPHKPIILGVMLTAVPAAPVKSPDQVLLDGERVVLTAAHEIELRCGEAALILSSDGRIQLRGTYITSHASATQRILGGSVNIN